MQQAADISLDQLLLQMLILKTLGGKSHSFLSFLPATSGPSSDDERCPSDRLTGADGLADVAGDLLAQSRPPASVVARQLDHQPQVAGKHGVAHGVHRLQTRNERKNEGCT